MWLGITRATGNKSDVPAGDLGLTPELIQGHYPLLTPVTSCSVPYGSLTKEVSLQQRGALAHNRQIHTPITVPSPEATRQDRVHFWFINRQLRQLLDDSLGNGSLITGVRSQDSGQVWFSVDLHIIFGFWCPTNMEASFAPDKDTKLPKDALRFTFFRRKKICQLPP